MRESYALRSEAGKITPRSKFGKVCAMANVFQRNASAQYEALGMFVEAFEAMVDEARESTISLVERDPHHGRLVAIALHHSNLTAKPLFDIFRAVVAEIVKDALHIQEAKKTGRERVEPPLRLDINDDPLNLTPRDRDALFGALKALSSEYDDLQQARNKLLHATWFIGYPDGDDPTYEKLVVRKYSATAAGLEPVTTLPKDKAELHHLVRRCDVARSWIAAIHACLGGPFVVKETFKRDGDGWCLFVGPTKMPLLGSQPPSPSV